MTRTLGTEILRLLNRYANATSHDGLKTVQIRGYVGRGKKERLLGDIQKGDTIVVLLDFVQNY